VGKQVSDLTAKLAAATRANAQLEDENSRLRSSQALRATAPVASAPPAAAPAPRTHVVVEGDTLTKISVQYYGTASRWSAIYQANRDVMPNEASLAIGTTLRIP